MPERVKKQMAESFGCCSRYMDCSDAKRCIMSHNPECQGCNYRKKLEAGIIYYGSNASKSHEETKLIQKPKELEFYIACYQQLFAVFSKNKNTFSYRLSDAQYQSLYTTFSDLGIPFRTKIDVMEDIEGDLVEIDGAANSRVVFSLDGQEYNTLNFNGYLIKNYFAEKIYKALKGRDIDCRVETLGTHSREKGEIICVKKIDNSKEMIKKEIPIEAKPVRYVQASIFDLVYESRGQMRDKQAQERRYYG